MQRVIKGYSALHAASYKGHTESLQLLLANNADVYAKTDKGDTALMLVAAYTKHTETIQALLKLALMSMQGIKFTILRFLWQYRIKARRSLFTGTIWCPY